MKYFSTLYKSAIGIIALFLYLGNLSFWFSVLLLASGLRIFPYRPWRRWVQVFVEQLPNYWIRMNTLIQQLTIPYTRYQIYVPSGDALHQTIALNPKGWYLLICNHQSWVDILILQRVFNNHIPPPKFFLKKSLVWILPIASWACWLLGFPFMQRYTPSQVAKNPALRKRNLEVTRKSCERYRSIPTTVANFVEGSRFTPVKQKAQGGAYQYLLSPKSEGIAFSLAVLGRYFDTLLNVTLVYSDEKISLWDFVCGRIKAVKIYIQSLPISEQLIGNYENDRQFRLYFQQWLKQLWQQKDYLIQKSKTGSVEHWELLPSYQNKHYMLSLNYLNKINTTFRKFLAISVILLFIAVYFEVTFIPQFLRYMRSVFSQTYC